MRSDPPSPSDALGTRISDLPERWLDVRCPCGGSTTYPCALLAERDPAATVADFASEVCCRYCRGKPTVSLLERGDAGAHGGANAYGTPLWSVLLVEAVVSEAEG